MEELVCKNCTFWVKDNECSGFGQCRRFPPKGAEVNAFPVTHKDKWCGEFDGGEEL